MMGDLKVDKSLRPTVMSRVLIDYVANKASYGADHFKLHGVEMPTIDSKRTGLSTASAYFVAGQEGLDSQLIRLDYQNKTLDRYDFGPGQFVTEPIYARSKTDAKRGYILSEVYSRADRKSRLTIFDGQNLAAGPIAEVLLNHHLPLGFHGFWAD